MRRFKPGPVSAVIRRMQTIMHDAEVHEHGRVFDGTRWAGRLVSSAAKQRGSPRMHPRPGPAAGMHWLVRMATALVRLAKMQRQDGLVQEEPPGSAARTMPAAPAVLLDDKSSPAR